MKTFLMAGFIIVAAHASGGEWVNWRSSGFLTPILIEGGFDNLATAGTVPVDAIDLENSQCAARVFRPAIEEGVQTNSGNIIVCAIKQKDGSAASIALPLADWALEAWGNQFDKYPFQALKQKQGDQLFTAMKKAYERSPRLGPMSHTEMYSPDGRLRMIDYSLDVNAEQYPAAYLACNEDSEWNGTLYVPYQTRCVFLFPTE